MGVPALPLTAGAIVGWPFHFLAADSSFTKEGFQPLPALGFCPSATLLNALRSALVFVGRGEEDSSFNFGWKLTVEKTIAHISILFLQDMFKLHFYILCHI